MIKKVLVPSTPQVATTEGVDMPLIHVHNRVPFANYESAVAEIEQKVLNPGEIAIVYYYDSSKTHGVAAMVVTGPITVGGDNEIFRNANDIDALVKRVEEMISAQNSSFEQLSEELLQKQKEILNSILEEFREDFIKILNAEIANVESLIELKVSTLDNELRTLIDDEDAILNNKISDGDRALDNRIDIVEDSIQDVIREYKAEDTSLLHYIKSQLTNVDNRIVSVASESSDNINSAVRKIDVSINDTNAAISQVAETVDELIGTVEEINEDIVSLSVDTNNKFNVVNSSVSNIERIIDTLKNDSSSSNVVVQEQIDEINNTLIEVDTKLNSKIDSAIESVNASINADKEKINTLNTSVNAIESDIKEVNESIEEVKSATDASIVELDSKIDTTRVNILEIVKNNKDALDGEIANTKSYVTELESKHNADMASLDASLVAYVDEKDSSLSTDISVLKGYIDEKIKNVSAGVFECDCSCANAIAELQLHVDAKDSSLSTDILNLKAYVDSEIEHIVIDASVCNCNWEERWVEIQEYIDEQIKNVSSGIIEIDCSCVSAIADLKTYVDATDASLLEILDAKIDDIANDVSAARQYAGTLHNEALAKIEDSLLESKEYSDDIKTSLDASINGIISEHESDITSLYNDINDINASIGELKISNNEMQEELEAIQDLLIGIDPDDASASIVNGLIEKVVSLETEIEELRSLLTWNMYETEEPSTNSRVTTSYMWRPTF